MRITWLGNAPYTTTGYGNQLRHLLPRLEAMGHEQAVIAFYGLEGGVLRHGNIRVYPRGQHPYGVDVMDAHTAHFNNGKPGGLCISLMDSWVIDPGMIRQTRWCLPAHAEVQLADGSTMPIGSIVAQRAPVQVAAYENGQLVAANITHWHTINAEESGEVIEIRTRSGKRLEVTADNDVAIVGKDGGLTWVSASCIQPGDVVYCYYSIPQRTEDMRDEPPGKDRQPRASRNRQASAPTHTDGMGLLSRDSGRRGNHHHSEGVQTQGADSYPAAQSGRDEHQRKATALVGREGGYEGQRSDKAAKERGDNLQAHPGGMLRHSDLGVQGLQHPDGHRAVPDYQGGTGAASTGLSGQSAGAFGGDVQSTVHPGGNRPLVEGARLEPERVTFVSNRGKPYLTVYDLTTDTGNFVAEGVLVHNCPLFPVDHEPLPAPIRERVRRAWARIVYSRFGERMVHDAGLDCHYAPHMIDCQVYKPQPQAFARQQLGIPQDAFVVGMVAANKGNPSRKCFQQQLQAFAELHRRHPDTWLYLHTAKGIQGGAEAVNLPELVDYLGLTDCTQFVDQYANFLGLPDEAVALTYSAFDVLTSVSMGEGFGIPIVEAQACGVPVVVGDWTAMSELCFAGWKVDKADADPLWTPLGAFQYVPRVGAIVEAYEAAYQKKGDLRLKKQARQGALAYDADDVAARYWQPLLETLEQRMAAEDNTPTFERAAGVAA